MDIQCIDLDSRETSHLRN